MKVSSQANSAVAQPADPVVHQAIRRSLKSDKERDRSSQSSHHTRPSLHLSIKSATAILPPKKVIKALYDYEPTNKTGHELAFRKGDYFHVLSREDDSEWYEACNPLTPSAKGLVPVAYFDIVGKQQRQSAQSNRTSDAHDSGYSEKGAARLRASHEVDANTPRATMHKRDPSAARAHAVVYGLVMYDFASERPDELDAKEGEPIIVVAQSNPEWFVAKPIGRLGGPGLIPVSFVQLQDPITGKPVQDPLAAVKAAGIPRVEEWKRIASEYKNSSISLGQVTTPQTKTLATRQNVNGMANGMANGMDRTSLHNPKQQVGGTSLHQQECHVKLTREQSRTQSPPKSSLLAPISASVPRYCFDNDMYWYIIECQMEDGRWWELSRYYADFYDFQIALLEAFPAEAGNVEGKSRTLPYMPGPVAHVTDAISNGRRENLDHYIKQIVAMPPHISKGTLVRKLFQPKPGQDFEIDPNAIGDDFRLSVQPSPSLQAQSQAQSQARQSIGADSYRSASAAGSGYTSAVPLPLPGSGRNSNQTHSRAPNGAALAGLMQPTALHSQASNLTTTSTGSNSKPQTTNPAAAALRVKVEFQEEIVAIRVPQDITFDALKDKIAERLKIDKSAPIDVKYRDDQAGTTARLACDEDLEAAIQRSANLRLVVGYAGS